MAKGTIIKRAKGQEIPEGFLDKIFSELKPNAYAYIISMDDEVLYQSEYKENLSKTDIVNLLRGHEDEIMLLLEHHGGDPGENLQPFQPDLLAQDVEKGDGKKDTCIYLAAVVEGDFSNFHRDKSTRPDAYFMVENVVRPRVDQLIDVCDGDTDKIAEQLRKEIIAKEFRDTPKTTGAIGIACSDGSFILYAREGQFTNFPWGQVSNTYGYTTPTATAPVADQPAEQSMAERMKSKMKSKILSTPPNQETQTAAVNKGTVPVIKQQREITKIVPDSWKNMNNREKKNWSNMEFGTIIAGWRQWKAGQAIKFLVEAKVPDNKDLSKLAEVVEFKKDTQPHVVKSEQTLPAAASDPKPSETGVSPMPELKAMRQKLMDSDEIKALVAAGAAPIMSMSDLEKLKAKTPSFSDLTGLDTLVGYQLSGKILDDLYKNGGEVGWNILKALIKHMQISCLKQHQEQAATGLSEVHEVKPSKISKIKRA